MDEVKLMQRLEEDTAKIEGSRRAAALTRLANKYYKHAPESDDKLLALCEQLIAANKGLFSIATLWLKKRESVIDLKYFPVIENWLYKYINSWGTCDVFCYRVLNPFVYKYPQLYANVLDWMRSPKLYVRRAAPVSLIRSTSTSFSVDYDLDKVLTVVEGLKDDPHHHIQKAIGWLLKYAYLTYPEQVLDYLRRNVSTLSRTTFRYALEKVPQDIRNEMMQL